MLKIAMSSANCDSLQITLFGVSETNKENKMGEMQDPCGTPAIGVQH